MERKTMIEENYIYGLNLRRFTKQISNFENERDELHRIFKEINSKYINDYCFIFVFEKKYISLIMYSKKEINSNFLYEEVEKDFNLKDSWEIKGESNKKIIEYLNDRKKKIFKIERKSENYPVKSYGIEDMLNIIKSVYKDELSIKDSKFVLVINNYEYEDNNIMVNNDEELTTDFLKRVIEKYGDISISFVLQMLQPVLPVAAFLGPVKDTIISIFKKNKSEKERLNALEQNSDLKNHKLNKKYNEKNSILISLYFTNCEENIDSEEFKKDAEICTKDYFNSTLLFGDYFSEKSFTFLLDFNNNES